MFFMKYTKYFNDIVLGIKIDVIELLLWHN